MWSISIWRSSLQGFLLLRWYFSKTVLSKGVHAWYTEVRIFILPFNAPPDLYLFPECTWVFYISGLLYLAADSWEQHIKYAQTFSPFTEQYRNGIQFSSLKCTWVSSLSHYSPLNYKTDLHTMKQLKGKNIDPSQVCFSELSEFRIFMYWHKKYRWLSARLQ